MVKIFAVLCVLLFSFAAEAKMKGSDFNCEDCLDGVNGACSSCEYNCCKLFDWQYSYCQGNECTTCNPPGCDGNQQCIETNCDLALALCLMGNCHVEDLGKKKR